MKRPLLHELLWPQGLAARFALASAALAAAAMLMVALTSWWFIDRQQQAARTALIARERQFQADRIAGTLAELARRMHDISDSTILATGLVDTAGKETYLTPFLNGIRQIDGIPVHLLFADFRGFEIASNNSGARFDDAQMQWLREQLALGRPSARVFGQGPLAELVALEPMRYSRTRSPEGALFYKLSLDDMPLEPGMQLAWGSAGANGTLVGAPAIYAPLQLRVVGNVQLARERWPVLQPYPLVVLIAAAMALAVFIAGRQVARRLTRDLSQLESFSREVVGAGIPRSRAPAGTSAEVASLSRSINEMLERLHTQHETLRAEGHKLEELAQALTDADRRKDEFLAMLAHELRNPLAPISAGAEWLVRHPGGEDRVRRTGEVIARQVRHMRKLVDDLLDVSRVTRGLVTLDRQPVDVSATLAAAIEQIRPQLEHRRQQLQLTPPPAPLAVIGDPARLVQVVGNLLHNASKYTPEGGHIWLSARADGADVVIEVRDDGCGIEPDFMPQLFGLFAQSKRDADRSQGGLGLGLPLVRQLVELHGGRVDAYSAGPHAGATFTVRLPLQPAQAEPLRVLVVDDNVDAARTLASLLELDGHVVGVAHDAESALEIAAATPADVYVLDIGLPKMDGIELARALRARCPGASDAAFIALTGYGQPSDQARTRDAGFAHHLVKPVDPQLLTQVLGRLVGARTRATASAAADAAAGDQAFSAA